MALTPKLELETHDSGTTGLSGIVNGNWERLDQIFDPALGSGDVAYAAFWRALVRSATNPTTEKATIEWDAAAVKPRWQAGTAAVAYAMTIALSCRGANTQVIGTVTGPLQFLSLTNAVNGCEFKAILTANGLGPHLLTFPAGWRFVGVKPTTIASSKKAVLELIVTGATDADVIARYTVEP